MGIYDALEYDVNSPTGLRWLPAASNRVKVFFDKNVICFEDGSL